MPFSPDTEQEKSAAYFSPQYLTKDIARKKKKKKLFIWLAVAFAALLTVAGVLAGWGMADKEPQQTMPVTEVIVQTTAATVPETEAPTTMAATEAPTEAVTEAVTEAPTEAPTEVPAETTAEPAESSHDYVLNTNTGKFHYPDCSSVDDMAEEHKYFFTGTRTEVIDMGYKPCGRCEP